jgi:hypothetical protein
MKVTSLLLALSCALTLAADNPAASPAITNRKSAIAGGADAITIPYLTSYQGKLTDTAGRAVSDSSYGVTFRLYTQPTGGSAYWSETQTVATRGGLFSVLLGSVEPVYYPDEGGCYLSMQVGATPELAPRVRIGSAAYAFCAWRADTAYRAGSAPAARPITPGVSNAEIASNAVTTDKIQDHTIKGADIAAPCSLVTQVGNPSAALMIRALNTGNGIRIDTADNNGIVIHGTRNDGITVFQTGATGVYAYNIHDYAIRGSAVLMGGYFQAESARGIGMVARSYNSVPADTAVRAYGKGLASGGWSTGFKDGSEAPCIVSAERMIIASGSARLIAGSAEIRLPDVFTKHVRPDVPVRLNVTPTADAPGLLVAERRGNGGFSVRLRPIAALAGSEDASFDWIAVGVLEEPSSEPVLDRER